jgi:glycosyltransferase involved in cell wall biosynthesis
VRPGVTLIVPYYRNVAMLARQAQEWVKYPGDIAIVVVDDGSPEPALDVIVASGLAERVRLFRVLKDIPWNRGGARNLGASETDTEWLMHIDIDHILPAECACAMMSEHWPPKDSRWYRFRRFRVGRADATRRKDAIADDVTFGEIKPHGDSYLCTRELYWQVGGYDEDYSGCLGGGSPFLRRLERAAPAAVFHQDVVLHVHTRDSVRDASDWALNRDTSEYTRRRKAKEMRGDTNPRDPLRFEWARVL